MNVAQTRTLILASSSPRRRELIRALPFPCEIVASHADEAVDSSLPPADAVEALALRKAVAVCRMMDGAREDGIVIGADTAVVCGGMLGKPGSEAEARRMLALLRGRTHEVYTGVACIDLRSGARAVSHRRTKVAMKAMTNGQIDRYIATGEPMDKAGAYGIQGIGATLVEAIEGCYFNVVGLPLSLLADMLRSFGLEVV